jgi:tetratricopeptide (TPR) repeat protein
MPVEHILCVRRVSTAIGMCLALSFAITGCATPSKSKVAASEPAPSDVEVVQSIAPINAPANAKEEQTSWIIAQDVSRIPKVAGVDLQLPPHIERRMNYAFDVVQRGATYSGVAEFRAVLGLCALELDAREGGTAHREALREGLVALEEADELSGDQMDWRESSDVRRTLAGHQTSAVNKDSATAIDAIHAVQAYYAFAEKRLTFACGGIPGSSLAFYGYGRTLSIAGSNISHSAAKAVLLQRIALAIEPQNGLAGNELGVLLARHGQLDEAERVFRRALEADPNADTYRNLAVVYARKGDEAASRQAMLSSETILAKQRAAAASNSMIAKAGDLPAKETDNNSTDESKRDYFAWAQRAASKLRR